MDETYKYPDLDVRVVGATMKEPQAIVITSNEGKSINRSDVNDITTATVRELRAKEGDLTVFAQQKNGEFDQYKMRVADIHYGKFASEVGEPKRGVPQSEVDSHVSSVKSQTDGHSFSENLQQHRKDYLNNK